MQCTLSIALAFCLALTVNLGANAKRFGGDKSLGSVPSHRTHQAQPAAAPNATAAAPSAARPTAAASGAPRWFGPLAGIAAGGLLASMFMDDGFEDIQVLDILLITLVAFVAFRFITAHRRQQNQGQSAMTGHTPMQREIPTQAPIFDGVTVVAAVALSPVISTPSWFNEEHFVGVAREHFMSLQQHWDVNEIDKTAEFATPQMLQWLKRERAETDGTYRPTYIDNLIMQLDGVDDQIDKTIVTLTFSGISKTPRSDQGEAFSRSRRIERAQDKNRPWLAVGIRQN